MSSRLAMPTRSSPTATRPLPSGEVHCWSVPLVVPPETLARLSATLSRDERDRAAQLRFERDQRRFVIAHGALRDILGRYLQTEPRRLGFERGPHGKPELRRGGVKFNLSHSADLALIAVTAGTEIGVDLEEIQQGPQSQYAEIARSFFSAPEVERLSRVPVDRYARAFYGCWTRKEAYVKARGHDLTTSLDSRSVPLPSWTFFTIQPAPGYIGALAIEGSPWRVVQREW